MDPRRKKQLVIWSLAIGIIAVLTYGFWPEPILVDTGIAERAKMQLTIEEEGKSRVKNRYIISAPVSGILKRIHLEDGDQVRAGDVIARLQPAPPQLLDERQFAMSTARLEAAKAAVEQAKQNLRLAEEEADYTEKEMERIKGLYSNGIGSEQDFDRMVLANQRAQANKKSAEFGVKIARHELESAEAALQWARKSRPDDEILEIRSPVNGFILNLPSRSERPVITGASLMEVGDLASLELQVDVLSSDAVRIEPMTQVMIKRWGGECTIKGRVRVVEPAGYTKISALGVEEQRVPVIIDITSDPKVWRRLGDGYRVVAEFIIWEGENVLMVPSSALFRSGNEWALFIVNEGMARRKIVSVGHQSGLYSEILDGLQEGQQVLTHPDERIEDGVSIEVRK